MNYRPRIEHELESVIRLFVKKFVDGLFTQLIPAQFLPNATQSSQQESCRGDSLHFRFLKMGRCPKDRGVALKFFFCDGLTWDDILNRHGGIVMQNGKTPLPSPLKGRS